MSIWKCQTNKRTLNYEKETICTLAEEPLCCSHTKQKQMGHCCGPQQNQRTVVEDDNS
jgi:hypothetical protein